MVKRKQLSVLGTQYSETADFGVHIRRRSRRGITLLELLLALALTALVMVIISMAIDLHLRTLDMRRTHVEQAELARAVLNHIAADVRGAVLYDPIDLSGAAGLSALGDLSGAAGSLDSLLGGAAGGGGSGGSAAGGGSGGSNSNNNSINGGNATGGSGVGGGGNSGSGANTGSGANAAAAAGANSLLGGADPSSLGSLATENTANISTTTAPTSVPGLYGNQYELQIDVSRLPRVDQYSVSSGKGKLTTTTIPSDVKTVAYFLGGGTGGANGGGGVAFSPNGALASASGGQSQSGLYRRELDRAITRYAADSAGLDESLAGGELLAPEVNYLEFRYFDGLDWYTDWDSDAMGGLPVAIEITIGLDPTGGKAPTQMSATELRDAATAIDADFTYRLVVHVPAARAIVAETTEDVDVEGMEAVGL